MNTYEAKQAAKKERYQELADKAEKESHSRFEASRKITSMIPMGQPILVGHHSEKRHRAALKRSDNNMRAAIAAQEKADYYKQKAKSTGNGGISSDDPEAVQKLVNKLDGLEKGQEYMKRLNASFKKAKGDIDLMADVSDSEKAKLKAAKNNYYLGSAKFVPFERYSLSNNNANITRIKKRIEQLKATTDKPAEEIRGAGFICKECKEDNRIRFIFDEKPSPEICQIMRSRGWKFSRYNMAWQRHLNGNGRCSARMVIKELKEMQQS